MRFYDDKKERRKKRIRFVLIVIGLLFAFMVGKTLMFRSKQQPTTSTKSLKIDGNEVAQKLAQAVRFQTISTVAGTTPNPEAFLGLHKFLEDTYPLVHKNLQLEKVASYSLMYTWKGSDPALPPIILMAHQDVVPIGDPRAWTHPPFEGNISDGFLWGRGTLDDKVNLIGILEATERLLKDGYKPKRTLIYCFGHDEEIGGTGAQAMAKLLKDRKTEPVFVLDEGGTIADGVISGLSKPVALIGISEKGYASFELTVRQPGGHSSMPPTHTAIGILSKAVTKLEDNPFAAHLDGPTGMMLDTLGPEMRLTKKFALANQWLLGPLVKRMMMESPETSATIRTTLATTMIEGGVKDNVLPQQAKATINCRILPGETIESVAAAITKTINDPQVELSLIKEGAIDPSPVSPTTSTSYQAIESTILQTTPNVLVSPFLVLGATDSRHFSSLTPNIYRISPFKITKEDIATIHGNNEKISIENCSLVTSIYLMLIRSTAG